jgi:hypothetical protein
MRSHEKKGFEGAMYSLPKLQFEYLTHAITSTQDHLEDLIAHTPQEAEIIDCISTNLYAISERVDKIYSDLYGIETAMQIMHNSLIHAQEMRAMAESSKDLYYRIAINAAEKEKILYRVLAKLVTEEKGEAENF